MAVRPTTQRRQAMAGKAIGEFSFKLVATRNSPGPAGSVLIEASWEGTATGVRSSLQHSDLRWRPQEWNLQ